FAASAMRTASHFRHAGFCKLRAAENNKQSSRMRMLIDLLNNEHGYARIFAERDGFGYELSTYRPLPTADGFGRLSGSASPEAAFQAAGQQRASSPQALVQSAKRTRG